MFMIFYFFILQMTELDMFDWQSQGNDSSQLGSMMVDEDYMELMSDTLFSTITSNQPFAFPDTREIGNFRFFIRNFCYRKIPFLIRKRKSERIKVLKCFSSFIFKTGVFVVLANFALFYLKPESF